ncbi:hypothetical protein E2C01_087600 [Portunus trituberculatus]|uniref:Uncharacterized protein n=1 Tax=Portunus trituberculatus TaxID=210409 RepID=A0A5B7JHQ5_PORTR|nr:hypothetical protein [Portunus trituberculatus]
MLHFFVLNSISHVSDHSAILSKSCTTSTSPTSLI